MKRKEFIFVYESIFANANGDPLNDNRPRIDEETGLQYVTMYRIKRTMRDYIKLLNILNPAKSNEILFQKEFDKEGKLKTTADRIKESGSSSLKKILERFVDIRLFGGVLAIKNNAQSLTGPVQISYGQSMHKVKEETVQTSVVMPSKKEREQGTMGIAYVVPYSVIACDGIVNQHNAKESMLSEQDVALMFEALWDGTAELKTTSKNQKPLMLLCVEFKEDHPNAYIGNLKSYLSLNSDKDDLEIRNTKDYSIEVQELVNKLNSLEGIIDNVNILRDADLAISCDGKSISGFKELFKFITTEKVV